MRPRSRTDQWRWGTGGAAGVSWERRHVLDLEDTLAALWAHAATRAGVRAGGGVAGFVGLLFLFWPALPLSAQDAVELRSPDESGAQQTRLSVSGGPDAQVKLSTTFNAQGNLLAGLGATAFGGIAGPGLSDAGTGRIYFDSTVNRFRTSENGAAYVDLGTVRSLTTGSGLAGGPPITTTGTISIADGGVTSSHIADGSISFGDIASNGAAPGQVMKWNGTAWAPAADDAGAAGVPTGGVIFSQVSADPALAGAGYTQLLDRLTTSGSEVLYAYKKN